GREVIEYSAALILVDGKPAQRRQVNAKPAQKNQTKVHILARRKLFEHRSCNPGPGWFRAGTGALSDRHRAKGARYTAHSYHKRHCTPIHTRRKLEVDLVQT